MERREADVPRLIETLVPLMKEFLETGQEALSYAAEFSRTYLELEFEWYAGLPDDVKPKYLETRCISGLFGPLNPVMRRDERWVSVAEHHRENIEGPVARALLAKMNRENRQCRHLPDRTLNPKTRQTVSIGMKDSMSSYEAYLFPKKTHPANVLFVELDSDFYVSGGFGRGEFGFFTGFLFPCLGAYRHYYSSKWDFERPEQTLHMFCKMLKYVYPYHVRLWEGYFGASQEARQQGALPECEEGLEHE
jgi:hypothetical protein